MSGIIEETDPGQVTVLVPIRIGDDSHVGPIIVHGTQTYKQARWAAAWALGQVNLGRDTHEKLEFANGVGLTA